MAKITVQEDDKIIQVIALKELYLNSSFNATRKIMN
jgi:hypothetical protein